MFEGPTVKYQGNSLNTSVFLFFYSQLSTMQTNSSNIQLRKK